MIEWVAPVALGGAAGATTRYGVGQVARVPGRDVFAVNVAGSFLLGLLTAVGVGGSAGLAFGTGFCGALTTFSSFSVHTVDRGGPGYAVGTLVAALVAVAAGALLGGAL